MLLLQLKVGGGLYVKHFINSHQLNGVKQETSQVRAEDLTLS